MEGGWMDGWRKKIIQTRYLAKALPKSVEAEYSNQRSQNPLNQNSLLLVQSILANNYY
jgi:hypothetical protein